MTRFRDREDVAAPVTIFLAGDVMTGRGVDQILPVPSKPELRENHVKHAATYAALAERAHGPIPAPVEPSYIWGYGLPVLQQVKPAASLVNLETSITVSNNFWLGKSIHYRMHPANVGCLQAAPIDVCALANNHVLDFGRSGLTETMDVLRRAGIHFAGAGRDLDEARRPARLALGGGAGLVVFSFGTASSGIPEDWAAGPSRSGVHLVADLSTRTADDIAAHVRSSKGPGDIAIASIHWGSNWGYEIDPEEEAFAHRLVDGGVDVVHGHSSHHVRAIEIYEGKLILYGCGDLVTDYEGIPGHEDWRGDLGAMFFATISPHDGTLAGLRLVPMQMRRLRLARPEWSDAEWLRATLNRISRPFGSRFERDATGSLVLQELHAGVPR